jgi:phage baseplate assembly protein V
MALPQLPQLRIDLDGAPLAERWATGFTELRVHQQLQLPTLCELSFVDVDPASPLPAVAIGARLSVALRQGQHSLFAGRVSALAYRHDTQHGRELTLRAYDDLMALRNRQTVRAHVALTVEELARELTADLGLSVQAEASGPVWQRLLQTGNDLDLLAGLAQRCGLYLALQDGVLRLLTASGQGEPLALRLDDNLLEARFEANGNGACGSVAAFGWDPWRGVPRTGGAASARSGRDVPLQAAASQLGGKDDRVLVARGVQADVQADSMAQAELDVRSAQALIFEGVALGDARLRPGARVRVSRVAAPVEGVYTLARVRHTLDPERGYLAELSSELPARRPASQGCAFTLGQVTQVNDPQQLGRVQVSLPAYGGLETDWLQVLAPGAGAAKGLVCLPDVGDAVALLVDCEDLAQAVVIGSLFSERGLPPGHERAGEGASFSFVSPGGQRLRLDDAAGTLQVRNTDGSQLEMAPGAITLHAKATLTIEAPGQRVLIRGQQIDFERA